MNMNYIFIITSSIFLTSAFAEKAIPIERGEKSTEFQDYLTKKRLTFVSTYLLSEENSYPNHSIGATIFHEYDPTKHWQKRVLVISKKLHLNHSDGTEKILDSVEFVQDKGYRLYGPDDVACKIIDPQPPENENILFVSAREVTPGSTSIDMTENVRRVLSLNRKSGVIQTISPSSIDCHVVGP